MSDRDGTGLQQARKTSSSSSAPSSPVLDGKSDQTAAASAPLVRISVAGAIAGVTAASLTYATGATASSVAAASAGKSIEIAGKLAAGGATLLAGPVAGLAVDAGFAAAAHSTRASISTGGAVAAGATAAVVGAGTALAVTAGGHIVAAGATAATAAAGSVARTVSRTYVAVRDRQDGLGDASAWGGGAGADALLSHMAEVDVVDAEATAAARVMTVNDGESPGAEPAPSGRSEARLVDVDHRYKASSATQPRAPSVDPIAKFSHVLAGEYNGSAAASGAGGANYVVGAIPARTSPEPPLVASASASNTAGAAAASAAAADMTETRSDMFFSVYQPSPATRESSEVAVANRPSRGSSDRGDHAAMDGADDDHAGMFASSRATVSGSIADAEADEPDIALPLRLLASTARHHRGDPGDEPAPLAGADGVGGRHTAGAQSSAASTSAAVAATSDTLPAGVVVAASDRRGSACSSGSGSSSRSEAWLLVPRPPVQRGGVA